ncbi:hypothetical protein PWT90_09474 [Aphanocladium album]|nr:hypothetical protein PWT90_09474 [Aphanocladium album]
MFGPQSHERRQAMKALRNQSIKIITGYTIIGTPSPTRNTITTTTSSSSPISALDTLLTTTKHRTGFCNVILSSIIFSSSYLIIPYSRPVVILIQVLPALAMKLLAPHALHYVPWKLRPFLFTACWSLAAFVATVTPANVPAVWRVLITMLAAATAAATEVSCMGYLRHFGRAGLAGWGIGTGAASLLWAVAPYFMAVSMHVVLRSALGYTHYFIGASLVASSMILRRPPVFTTTTVDSIKFDARAAEEGGSFVIQEPEPGEPQTKSARFEHNLRLIDPLAKPYIRSLCFAFTLQALVAPGISRAYGQSSAFGSFETFYAIYSLAFQAGNLVSRSTILLIRFRQLARLTSLLAVVSAAILFNGVASVFSSPYLVLPSLFVTGLLGGAVYANIYASALEQMATDKPADAEFGLGAISAGETAGTLCGSLLAALVEQSLCSVDAGTGTRWCYTRFSA